MKTPIEFKNNLYGGSLEQLTTPEMKEQDVVYPGENWFFYWKTSPSLWEAKLREYQGANPIFVPINWSLHSEYSNQFDFGDDKPETDLARLNQAAVNAGRELKFFIPLTPFPFLIHGGIPSYLARNMSENRDRLAISVLDNSDRVNKIYSFYDPKVFQAFRKFVYNVGQYFSQLGLNAPIYGMESMRLEGQYITSYFNDDSAIFESGFSRYLGQLEENEPQKIEEIKKDVDFLKSLKSDYGKIIQKLYFDAATESLGGHWAGVLKVCHLGGGTGDLFKRIHENWNNEKDYFKPLFLSLAYGIYPSSVLLNFNLKKSSLGKALQDVVTSTLAEASLNPDSFDDDLSYSFKSLFFFEFFNTEIGHFDFDKEMECSGLKYYLGRELPWSVKITDCIPADFDELDPRRVHFFFGSRLNEKSFHQILKLFLSGMKIFIDVKNLDSKLADKLDVFFIENSIQTECINYISPVLKATLGDGLILTYDSSKLHTTSLVKRAGFWDKIMSYMDIKHLCIEADEDVEYFWKARSSNTYELNFEEIRRVSFYNPTSYKKKVLIKSSKNFAFVKHLNEMNSEVKSTPLGIDIYMLPGGSVTLDFGYFDI